MMKTKAKIVNGKPVRTQEDNKKLAEFYRKSEGQEITEQVKLAELSRSDAQNKFWHSCIWPAAMRALQLQGHERAWDKEWIKEGFLKKTFLTVNANTPYEYVKHTSSLGVKEFWKFTCQCLVLIESIGGSLSPEEQEEYQQLIAKYKLEAHIADAVGRMIG